MPIPTEIRSASVGDIAVLESMLRAYMAEAFNRPWEGSTDALARDGFGSEFQTLVAEVDGEVIAFACWRRAYDLHHCAVGAEITDMYVRRSHRGRGIAATLLAAAAARIQAAGGRFLKGRADAKLAALYGRLAVVCPGAECYVGNRAFRQLASLAGAPPRSLVRALPDMIAQLATMTIIGRLTLRSTGPAGTCLDLRSASRRRAGYLQRWASAAQ